MLLICENFKDEYISFKIKFKNIKTCEKTEYRRKDAFLLQHCF